MKPMTDKLEEVARALHAQTAKGREGFDQFPIPPYEHDTAGFYANMAKAAIEAHEKALEAQGLVIVPRKPTEEMKIAGIDVSPMGRVKYDDGGALGKWVSYDTDKTSEIWKAMAEAALEGKE